MIKEFRNKYNFLSNFYTCSFVFEGYTWHSVETAFQAMKDPSRMEEFVNLNPSKAKQLGRKVKLRSDWEQIKDQLMEKLVRLKFQDPTLKEALINTGDELLVEGTWWGDTYWGISLKTGKGQNHLGKILMKIREEIK